MLHAVVPAAGVGSRMQADLPKQYLPLAGKRVIEQTLDLLLRVSGIETITVAISDGDPYWPELPISRHARINRAPGGAERADSVLNALRRLRQQAAGDDWVLVHDAARPCVRPSDVQAVADAVAWVRGRHVPFGVWIDEEAAPDATAGAARAGLERRPEPYPGMAVRPLPKAPSPPV